MTSGTQPVRAFDRKKKTQWGPPADGGLRRAGIALLWATAIMAPVLIGGGWMMYGSWREAEEMRMAEVEASKAYERVVAAVPQPVVPFAEAVHGRELFSTVCIACHGSDGKGMPGLGKNLVESN